MFEVAEKTVCTMIEGTVVVEDTVVYTGFLVVTVGNCCAFAVGVEVTMVPVIKIKYV